MCFHSLEVRFRWQLTMDSATEKAKRNWFDAAERARHRQSQLSPSTDDSTPVAWESP
jgi:hypothetical protein